MLPDACTIWRNFSANEEISHLLLAVSKMPPGKLSLHFPLGVSVLNDSLTGLKNMKIAVVGGGWYGCHFATTLRMLGYDVTLFEQHRGIFPEASGNNQFRLHQGFHYARHHRTRVQTRDGFSRFIERYPFLTEKTDKKYYVIPKEESLIDFMTYRQIMISSGIDFHEVRAQPYGLGGKEVGGIIRCDERVILTSKARQYFWSKLSDCAMLGAKVVLDKESSAAPCINGQRFDWLIDTTWGHLTKPPVDVYYEPTILGYYRTDADFPAYTFVDGDLCSLYPTEKRGVYTLSSVPHTPLARFHSSAEARAFLGGVSSSRLAEHRARMEAQIAAYLPSFAEEFTYLGPQLAIKTKPVGAYDDRSCYVHQDQRVISVLSGKIDSIFYSFEKILNILGIENEPALAAAPAENGYRGEASGFWQHYHPDFNLHA